MVQSHERGKNPESTQRRLLRRSTRRKTKTRDIIYKEHTCMMDSSNSLGSIHGLWGCV